MLVGCESGSLALKQGGKNSLLGLGLLIRPPAESLLQVLWAANSVLEDVFNHVLNTAQQVVAILETSQPPSNWLIGRRRIGYPLTFTWPNREIDWLNIRKSAPVLAPCWEFCVFSVGHRPPQYWLTGAVLRIRDAFPGSDLFPPRIQDWQDPGSGSASNNFSIFDPKMRSKCWSRIPDPGSWLWIFFHPVFRIQGSKKARIPDPQQVDAM